MQNNQTDRAYIRVPPHSCKSLRTPWLALGCHRHVTRTPGITPDNPAESGKDFFQTQDVDFGHIESGVQQQVSWIKRHNFSR